MAELQFVKLQGVGIVNAVIVGLQEKSGLVVASVTRNSCAVTI